MCFMLNPLKDLSYQQNITIADNRNLLKPLSPTIQKLNIKASYTHPDICSKEKYLKQELALIQMLSEVFGKSVVFVLFVVWYYLCIFCVACWGPRSVMCLLPLLLSILFIEIASFTEPGVQGFRQTGWPASTRDPPIPARPALGFRRMPGFLRGLGLCACHASLLTELLRRLSVFFLYSFYSLQNWKISWSNTFTQAKRKV